MDDIKDNGRYPPNPYGMNQGYGSSDRQKLPVCNTSYPGHADDQYVEEVDDYEDVDDEEEDDDDDNDENGVQRIGKDVFEDDDDDDDDYGGSQRHQKKRKLKSLLSSYEFAPRVPAPAPSTAAATAATAPKPSFGGRNPLSDWSEHETFILLDAWGERFLRHGRKSLRSEEWQEVAERVSQGSRIERTDTQCRNRLDTLKKKYKKEMMKLTETGSATSKWVYFKKMDMLLTATPQQAAGISCGMDSGEYVFMTPKAYLNRANGMDEARDSPANSEETADGEEDDSEDLPPKRSRYRQSRGDRASSFKLIADSIQKFSEIYEKIENSKRQQMLELEKMRMDFHRELELQKRQIVERAQAEIARIRQGSDEENDVSAENVSG